MNPPVRTLSESDLPRPPLDRHRSEGFGLANGEGWGPVSEWLVRAVVADATGGGCELGASMEARVRAVGLRWMGDSRGDDDEW
ncbi:hypothetical protein V6N13_051284 [Hibiscus sabdariffa]